MLSKPCQRMSIMGFLPLLGRLGRRICSPIRRSPEPGGRSPRQLAGQPKGEVLRYDTHASRNLLETSAAVQDLTPKSGPEGLDLPMVECPMACWEGNRRSTCGRATFASRGK